MEDVTPALILEIRADADEANRMRVDDVIDHFLGGECYALALALNERTGWPLVLFTNGDHWTGPPFHVAVRHPSGDYMDVAWPDSEFCHQWPVATEMTADEFRAFIDQGWVTPPSMEVAHPFADILLRLARSHAVNKTGPHARPTARNGRGR